MYAADSYLIAPEFLPVLVGINCTMKIIYYNVRV